MVVFDSTMLLLLMRPDANISNGKPLEHVKERISLLLEQLEKDKTTIVIPAPAFSELLIKADDARNEIIANIRKSSRFRIQPFDTIAAIELAEMTRLALKNGDKRNGVDGSWAKIKFDRQIIAIAKVVGASTIYTDDKGLQSFAKKFDIKIVKLSELPLPEQGQLI
ncbi:MAG: PIN domain-containing protein [Rickettsiales bacterium]